MHRTAVIVGGGFAGLTAGYELRKAGWEVTLLEAADEVGGRVRTVRKNGYALDVGATQMSTGYKQYLALCDELGMGDQMVASSPHIGLLRRDRVHVIDGRHLLSSALTPALSLSAKFKLLNTVRDAIAIRPPVNVFDVSASHAVDTESAADYCRRRLSGEIYDVLVDPLIRAYVMNNANNVSALEWFAALKNIGGQAMLSLRGGNDRLPKALAGHLDVRLKSAAQAVRKSADGVEVSWTDAEGRQQQTRADACVLATRLPEAIAIHPPTAQIAGRFGTNLRYNRAWVVQLGYRQRPDSPVVGVLIPTAEQADIGLLWFEHNKNPDRAPQGHALFSVYSDEASNDRCLAMSDEELLRMATQFVERLFPELRGAQDMVHVTRWPMAIPNSATGMYTEMHAMKSRLDPADPVQLAGDYFTCTGQNSAIYYGKRAAEQLIAQQPRH